MKYKIKTPNELYSGVTEGVPFLQGLGETEDKNIRNVLVNDYGYEDVSDDSKPIEDMTVPELKEHAKELSLTGYHNLKRDDLINLINGGNPKEKQPKEEDPKEKQPKEEDPEGNKQPDEGKENKDNQVEDPAK